MSNCKKNSVLLLKGEKKESSNEDSYVSILSQAGFEVTCIPVLEFRFINLDHLLQALSEPENYSDLLLTSPRAVEAISKAITDPDYLQLYWSKKSTYAVGSVTGISVANLGLQVKGAESGNSENLAPIIINDSLNNDWLKSKPVLFPCGSLRLEILPAALEKAGIRTHCITVYETTANANLRCYLESFMTVNGFAEYIVFYSPSGVDSAFQFLQQLGFFHSDVKLVAIGPTTEKAILARGFEVWGTSAKPTAEHLLRLLMSQNKKI